MGAVAQSSNLETMFLACGLTMAFVLLIIYILFRQVKSSVNMA
jgi:flagellar biogenesis protein FliO